MVLNVILASNCVLSVWNWQALQSLSIKYGVFQSIYNYWKNKVFYSLDGFSKRFPLPTPRPRVLVIARLVCLDFPKSSNLVGAVVRIIMCVGIWKKWRRLTFCLGFWFLLHIGPLFWLTLILLFLFDFEMTLN